jgi:hypothetical protein
MGEQTRYRRWHTQPPAQHLRDLAPSDELAAVLAYRLWEPARRPQRPRGWRALLAGQRSHDPRPTLYRRSEHHRGEVRHERALIEQFGADFGVGSAAGMEEEAPEVRLCRGPRIDSEPLRQAHGDQRAL